MDEQSIFIGALEKLDIQQRKDWLDEVCGEDVALKQRIELLLRQYENASSFLEDNAPTMETTMAPSVLRMFSKELDGLPSVVLRSLGTEPILRPSSSELPQGELGRYQLHGEIARGGMGVIIRGRDADLGRELAVKVLLEKHKDKAEFVNRFVEEAQIGGQLQHPGIVPVYELGRFDDKRPFFAMKLVKGRTLAAMLRDRSNTEEELGKFVGIYEQVCHTMAYAHSRGVIHRDLKPANIMVGAFGEVQIMDWGLAKVLSEGGVTDERLASEEHSGLSVIRTVRSEGSEVADVAGSETQFGSLMGTVAYMPPEQALGEVDRLDERTDVFALGAILAEILTEKPPYVGSTNVEIHRLAMDGNNEACFSRIDSSSADAELGSIAKDCLAPHREARPRDASVVAKSVSSYQQNVQTRLRDAELSRISFETKAIEEGRRRRIYAWVSFGAILTCLIAGLAAIQFRSLYRQNQTLAQVQAITRLAAESRAVRYERPTRSALLALEAVAMSNDKSGSISPVAHEALLNASQEMKWQALVGNETPLSDLLVTRNHVVTLEAIDNSSSAPAGGVVRIWRLGKLTDSSTICGHDSNKITCMAVSEDGRWLVTGGTHLRVWDLSTDAFNTETLVENHHTQCLDINSNECLVAQGGSGEVRRWPNLAIGRSTARVAIETARPQQQIDISRDGRWLAGINAEKAELWDLSNPNHTPSRLTLAQPERVDKHVRRMRMEMSDDGKWLVTVVHNTVTLWNLSLEDPSTDPVILNAATYADIQGIAISPDSKWFVAAGRSERELRAWDLTNSPSEVADRTFHFRDSIGSVKFSPDCRWLVGAGSQGLIRLWDMQSESQEPIERFKAHDEMLNLIAFSPGGRALATASNDGAARLWSFNAGGVTNSFSLPVMDADVFSDTAISSDGRVIATELNSRDIRLWDFRRSIPKSVRLAGDGYGITSIRMSPNDQWLAAAYWDGSAQVWDLNSNAIEQSMTQLGRHSSNEPPENQTGAIVIGPSSRWLATGSADGKIRLWDLRNLETSKPIVLDAHQGAITAMTITPDGRRLISSGRDDSATIVWDLTNPEIRSSAQLLGDGNAYSAVVDEGGRWFYTANGRQICRWDLTSSDPSKPNLVLHGPRPTDGGIWRLAVSPNGRWLFSAHFDLTAFLWDLNESRPQPRELRWHRGAQSVDISRDSRWLAVGSFNNAYVCDLAAEVPEKSVRVLRGHTSGIGCVRISADSKWLVTDSKDRTIRRWNLDEKSLWEFVSNTVGRELTERERHQYDR